MPKVVDASQRRREIAEAVFRVIERAGLAQASLRNVAAEAGLAIGSVRHYCGTHDELLELAFTALVEDVSARLVAHRDRLMGAAEPGERRKVAVEMFGELLPWDSRRQRETAVWLAFMSESRTDPRLRPYALRFAENLRALTVRVLHSGVESGTVRAEIDVGLEADRLRALVDGLTLQAVVAPELLPSDSARKVLSEHLETLAPSAGS